MIYIAFIIVCCIAVVLFLALVAERREHIDARESARRFLRERDEERKWSDKLAEERRAAMAKCEEYANNNAELIRNVHKLRGCTVEYALQNWERSECADLPGRTTFTEGDITLIYENGLISWSKTDSVQIAFKNVPDYEAPAAEVVSE